MGVRITNDKTYALYDSVSGFAFGPTFSSEEEAQAFLEFVADTYGKDARLLTDEEMENIWVDFNEAFGK